MVKDSEHEYCVMQWAVYPIERLLDALKNAFVLLDERMFLVFNTSDASHDLQKHWNEIRSMDQKRGFVACASTGSKIFALGGFGPKHLGTITNRLQIERSVEYFETR